MLSASIGVQPRLHFSHKKICQNKANSPFACNAALQKQTQANPIFGLGNGEKKPAFPSDFGAAGV